MKRFLALLLTLVMLVSVCGLQAFAADGDTSADTGDELVVYTRSGATRTFHVGDTFSYTYWFRLHPAPSTRSRAMCCMTASACRSMPTAASSRT